MCVIAVVILLIVEITNTTIYCGNRRTTTPVTQRHSAATRGGEIQGWWLLHTRGLFTEISRPLNGGMLCSIRSACCFTPGVKTYVEEEVEVYVQVESWKIRWFYLYVSLCVLTWRCRSGVKFMLESRFSLQLILVFPDIAFCSPFPPILTLMASVSEPLQAGPAHS